MVITVEAKVPYDEGYENRCRYGDGDFWGYAVCGHHTFRDRFHGKKAPPERHRPKCKLFDEWLDEPYVKCEKCLQKCREGAS